MRWVALSLVACHLSLVTPQAVYPETIRLQDGTEFSGDVVQRDHESVIVRVPRANVASVDGKAVPPAVTVGVKAPDFAAIDLSGTTHHLDSEPKRPALIQFWATWCPHCRSDLGLMQDLWTRYGEKGLRILSISVDENLNALTSLVRERQLTYPIIAAHHQPGRFDGDIPERYESRGIPAYFLVDRKGIIRRVYSGAITETNADLPAAIDQVLAEAATRSARR